MRLYHLAGIAVFFPEGRQELPSSLPSAPKLPDPLFRKVVIEGGASNEKVADHVSDEGIAPGVPQHRLGPASVCSAALPFAAGPCRGKAGHGTLPGEIPLELGQRPEHVDDQRAAGGGGVDTRPCCKNLPDLPGVWSGSVFLQNPCWIAIIGTRRMAVKWKNPISKQNPKRWVLGMCRTPAARAFRQNGDPGANLRFCDCRYEQLSRWQPIHLGKNHGIRRGTHKFRYHIRIKQDHDSRINPRPAARASVRAVAIPILHSRTV